MNPGRVKMTASPFVGATAVDAVRSTGSADMEACGWIELATFSSSG